MNMKLKDIEEIYKILPKYDKQLILKKLKISIDHLNKKIVVLDDDPTGVQTVHDVFVYTEFTLEAIREAFNCQNPMFFILTNSRGLTETGTIALHKKLSSIIAQVSRETGKDFLLISRSDSTLRGHYPLETQVLKSAFESEGICFDGEILIPFFPEGGRFTINNEHYVTEGTTLIPASNTEFAKDKTFPFRTSNLPDWISEKTKKQYKASDVSVISLEDLRAERYNKITKQLLDIQLFNKVIVNAVEYDDLRVFTTALISAIEQGKNYIYRTAAAFPKILGSIKEKPYLSVDELVGENVRQGGLIIVGSHVEKTTAQLSKLLELPNISSIEFNQHLVFDTQAIQNEINRVVSMAEKNIEKGINTVIYTRRKRLDVGENMPKEEMELTKKISDAVTEIVEKIEIRPAWIIAKGGITSSEIGVRGLKVRKAKVLGQVLKGVPVWQTGIDSRFPKLTYIIFPGNVGSVESLYHLVKDLANNQNQITNDY